MAHARQVKVWKLLRGFTLGRAALKMAASRSWPRVTPIGTISSSLVSYTITYLKNSDYDNICRESRALFQALTSLRPYVLNTCTDYKSVRQARQNSTLGNPFFVRVHGKLLLICETHERHSCAARRFDAGTDGCRLGYDEGYPRSSRL